MRIASCSRCKKQAWVNHCTQGGDSLGELCADCFDQVNHDKPARNPGYSDSGPNHNDPGFDNVIRAMEEDR